MNVRSGSGLEFEAPELDPQKIRFSADLGADLSADHIFDGPKKKKNFKACGSGSAEDPVLDPHRNRSCGSGLYGMRIVCGS